MSEIGNEYRVIVDVPGAEMDDLKLTPGPVQGTLALTTRIREDVVDGGRLLFNERTMAGGMRYARLIPVAPDADIGRLRASVVQGVLTVHVPKTTPSRAEKPAQA